jgi:DNA-binding winged helix-turn-helix (wHTH) protein/Tol biopolymer transport system component
MRDTRKVRFSFYEFDLATGDLTREGTRLRLENQPAKVLALLIQAGGKLVSRQEIVAALWPFETEGDFDGRLDKALTKLRASLNEDPAKPRFIETLKGRGYRFLAPVSFDSTSLPVKAENGTAAVEFLVPASVETGAAKPLHSQFPANGGWIPGQNGSGKKSADAVPATSKPVLPAVQFERYQSANGIEREPKEQLRSYPQSLPAASVIRHKGSFPFARFALFILTGAILTASAGFLMWRLYPRPQAFSAVSTKQVTSSGDVTAVSMSPDGKSIAEVRSSGQNHALWVRNISLERDVQVLPPTPLTYDSLTFSQDGDELYFVRKEKGSVSFSLYRMPVFGGDPELVRRNVEQMLAISPDEKRVAWIKDDEVHVVGLANSEDVIVAKGEEDRDFFVPAWSPDGRFLAFETRRPRWDVPHETKKVSITIIETGSRIRKEIPLPAEIESVEALTWLPSGKEFLVLFQKASYSGVRNPGDQFAALSLTGKFRQITNDMMPHSGISLSTNGRSVATLVQQGNSEISIFDSAGVTLSSTARFPRDMQTVNWVGDDRLFAFDPWPVSLRLDTGEVSDIALKFPAEVQEHGSWSSSEVNSTSASCSSDRILIAGDLDGVDQLYLIDTNGQFVKTLLKTWANSMFCSQGAGLVYYVDRSVNDPAIWSMRLADETTQKVMPLSHFVPVVYSSDGKQAAYVSEQGDRATAVIIDLNQHKIAGQVPLPGFVHGSLPHFTPDRRSVAFVKQEKNVFTLALAPLDGSTPRPFPKSFDKAILDFGWSPSGKRLAILWDASTSDGAVLTDDTK